MKLLFVHQNFPAQFRHVVRHLAQQGDHEIVFITHPGKPSIENVRKIEYRPHREPARESHPYLRSTESAVIHGQGAAKAALALQREGFRPDIIVGHPGWGETLYLKDVFTQVPHLSFCEFFYRGQGADVGFDPEYPADLDTTCRTRTRAAPLLLALEAADRGYAPTQWQKSQFPSEYHGKIEVIHDGIDTDRMRPDRSAEIRLPNGTIVRAGDPVVTYVARNLEPYRGFHSFMRALPEMFRHQPRANVLIVGGDGVSYGTSLPKGDSYRARLLDEVDLSPDRVHFLGTLPYAEYRRVLQVSAAHVYLTYPFVLSWSCLEAMAAGCLLIGSATPPVEEVISDGENGLLVDFFDYSVIAARINDALSDPGAYADMRTRARETVLARYKLDDCRGALLRLMGEMAGGRLT